MNKEEINKLLTEMEYKREIAKLKSEVRKKDKLINKLEEKIKLMKGRVK